MHTQIHAHTQTQTQPHTHTHTLSHTHTHTCSLTRAFSRPFFLSSSLNPQSPFLSLPFSKKLRAFRRDFPDSGVSLAVQFHVVSLHDFVIKTAIKQFPYVLFPLSLSLLRNYHNQDPSVPFCCYVLQKVNKLGAL